MVMKNPLSPNIHENGGRFNSTRHEGPVHLKVTVAELLNIWTQNWWERNRDDAA